MRVCVLSYSIAVKSYKTFSKQDKSMVDQSYKSRSLTKKNINKEITDILLSKFQSKFEG